MYGDVIDKCDIAGAVMEVGSLLLTEEGAVLESAGDLENDERLASGVIGLVTLAHRVDPVAIPGNVGFKKLTITYDDYCFIVCMSNKKIHVVKKLLNHDRNEGAAVNV